MRAYDGKRGWITRLRCHARLLSTRAAVTALEPKIATELTDRYPGPPTPSSSTTGARNKLGSVSPFQRPTFLRPSRRYPRDRYRGTPPRWRGPRLDSRFIVPSVTRTVLEYTMKKLRRRAIHLPILFPTLLVGCICVRWPLLGLSFGSQGDPEEKGFQGHPENWAAFCLFGGIKTRTIWALP